MTEAFQSTSIHMVGLVVPVNSAAVHKPAKLQMLPCCLLHFIHVQIRNMLSNSSKNKSDLLDIRIKSLWFYFTNLPIRLNCSD